MYIFNFYIHVTHIFTYVYIHTNVQLYIYNYTWWNHFPFLQGGAWQSNSFHRYGTRCSLPSTAASATAQQPPANVSTDFHQVEQSDLFQHPNGHITLWLPAFNGNDCCWFNDNYADDNLFQLEASFAGDRSQLAG